MQLLSIGVSEKSDFITSQLQEQYNQFENSDISLKIEQLNGGDTDYIICNINENNANISYVSENIRLATINVLADYIINQYEIKLINRILSTNYCYFNLNERKEILSIALKSLKDSDCKSLLNNLYLLRRKNVIIRKLIEYFDSNSEINIDGFVTFRLQEYIKDLESVVERAIDDYLMEREYKEFIRLLKYFVEVQEPKLEVVHIIANTQSKYMLLDEDHIEITNQCIQDFMTEINEGEINYDDLLVSSLITLAPQKVIIHGVANMSNIELLETIKNVFIGKVMMCDQCDLCIDKIIREKSPL